MIYFYNLLILNIYISHAFFAYPDCSIVYLNFQFKIIHKARFSCCIAATFGGSPRPPRPRAPIAPRHTSPRREASLFNLPEDPWVFRHFFYLSSACGPNYISMQFFGAPIYLAFLTANQYQSSSSVGDKCRHFSAGWASNRIASHSKRAPIFFATAFDPALLTSMRLIAVFQPSVS